MTRLVNELRTAWKNLTRVTVLLVTEERVRVDDQASPTFADRLNALYDQRRRPDGKPYTNAQIAEKINNLGRGFTITEAYLSQLRSGARVDPRLSRVQAIATAFDVPISYFGHFGQPDPNEVDQRLRDLVRENPAAASQVDLLLQLRDAGIRRLGARGAVHSADGRAAIGEIIAALTDLSPEARDAVLNVAKVMRKAEGSNGDAAR